MKRVKPLGPVGVGAPGGGGRGVQFMQMLTLCLHPHSQRHSDQVMDSSLESSWRLPLALNFHSLARAPDAYRPWLVASRSGRSTRRHRERYLCIYICIQALNMSPSNERVNTCARASTRLKLTRYERSGFHGAIHFCSLLDYEAVQSGW